MEGIAITVHEDAGVGRLSEPVAAGIPFPAEAAVLDPARLRLVDERGEEVAAQYRVSSRWDAPAGDPSAPLKWIEAAFLASVAGGGTRRLRLFPRDEAAPRGRAGAFGIAVAGGADVAVAEAPFLPLARSEGGTIVVSAGRVEARFSVEAPGPMRIVATGPGGASGSTAVREIVLDENGPIRARVRVRAEIAGGFDEMGGRHPLLVTSRWTFHRNSPEIRLQVTVENPDRARAAKRLGRLALELVPDGSAWNGGGTVTFGGVPGSRDADAATWRLVQTGDGLAAGGFTVRAEGPRPSIAARGRRAEGWIARGDGRRFVVLGMRRFWENHPKGLASSRDALALELFPALPGGTIVGGGRAKTHDVWIHVAGEGSAADRGAEAARAANAPLRATVDPAWLRDAGALGALSVEDERAWPSFERTADAVVGVDSARGLPGTLDDERAAEGAYGWLDFGDTWRDGDRAHRRFGNLEFDLGWVLLRQYLREPDHDRAWLDAAEAALRHLSDVDVLHTDDDQPASNRGVRKHDAGDVVGHSRQPELSHVWVRGLLALHLVTGDDRAREVAVGEIGRWIAARESPPGSGRLLHADEVREVGWPLVALVDLYEVTGDPETLALARRIVSTHVLPAVDPRGSLAGSRWLRRRDGFAPWQQAYVADGLGRLLVVLRRRGERWPDGEAALVAMLDHLAGPAWIREPTTIHGRRYPETVAFVVRPDGTADAREASMSQALADPFVWGWRLTGDPRYREAAERSMRWLFPDGPERYYHPSVRTPAKNAAVRLYFGEAFRWMEQVSRRAARPPSGTGDAAAGSGGT